MFILLIQTLALFSQEDRNVIDSVSINRIDSVSINEIDSLSVKDSIPGDSSLAYFRKPSKNAVDKKVTYNAVGLIKRDIINRRVVLVDKAVVNYGEIEIKADSIVFDMTTNILFAIGKKDTTGKISGTPVFKEGTNEFEAKELTYNFKSRKAFVKNIVTKQDQGLIHSQYTKLLEDGTSNIAKSTYSTCDADTPHFYINLPKARVYPGEKIISGPGNLVIEGIPLPLFIPFGYFPIQTKKAASGILFPRIGEERLRGYSLTEGGYYFAINNFIDFAVKGNVYANGSWMGTAQTSYNKLYKYNGNFSFNYANNISGHKGLTDFSKSTNYRVGWTFSQDPKASPGSRFSASVNMSSSGFDRNNSYNVQEHAATQRQSSVSYSKSWVGTPFNFSASMNHSQNARNKTVALNLPKATFSVGRIYPLKSRRSTGPTKWYQELQFQYTANLDNQINTKDSLLFTPAVWQNMKSGFKHEAPLSLQIRPFKNFSISPSVTYSGVFYSQKINKVWDTDLQKVVKDTIKGVFYGQSLKPALNASFSPQLFGMYTPLNPDSRIVGIRHVVKPSVGFSYIPAFDGLSSSMYKTVQSNAEGTRFDEYSIFEGNIFGTPSLSKRSGNVSFSLVNIVEAKVYAKNDTTGKAKKVKIIDNLGIGTSYNIFADSMRWAPVSMQMRTTLLNNINITANGTFSLYGLNDLGRPVSDFALSKNGKLMRLTSFGTTLTFSLSDLLSGKKDKQASQPDNNAMNRNSQRNSGFAGDDDMNQMNQTDRLGKNDVAYDEYGYPLFDVPWALNINYNINYSKPELKSSLKQTLSFDGNATITKKMRATFRSGYDFKSKVITMTTITVSRDLHCWEMLFNWIPIGYMQGWNFTIRVKASVLGDLKYERRKDYHDQY